MGENEKIKGNFYYPDGKSKFNNENEFVDFYKEVYYYNNRDFDSEERINAILESEQILTEDDIGTILAWKTSQEYDTKREAIVTRKSKKVLICVKQVWDILNGFIKHRNKNEDKRFCEIDPFCGKSKDDCIDLISKLSKSRGMGIVYALTILYFLSSGRCPIYDKYACTAIDAIVNGKEVGDEMTYCSLSPSAKITFNEDYHDYYSKIKSVFGEKYRDREVDQALWMYGHLFKIQEIGRKEKKKEGEGN